MRRLRAFLAVFLSLAIAGPAATVTTERLGGDGSPVLLARLGATGVTVLRSELYHLGNSGGDAVDDVSIFARGFTMQNAALFGPEPDNAASFKRSQVQEPCVFVHPTEPTTLIMFYCGMDLDHPDNEDAGNFRSAVYRATASVSAPDVWSDHTQLLDSTTLGLDYLRLNCVVRDGGTWNLYVSDGSTGIYLATSSDDEGDSPSFGSTPILTQSGQGRSDGGAPALARVIIADGTWWMLYAMPDLGSYWRASSGDGIAWTKHGGSTPAMLPTGGTADAGGLEWGQLLQIADKFVHLYEANEGDGGAWSINVATATAMDGTWTKFEAPILTASGGSAFAQAHVATGSVVKIEDVWTLFFQGTNRVENVGAFGPWAMGIATLNPMGSASLRTPDRGRAIVSRSPSGWRQLAIVNINPR